MPNPRILIAPMEVAGVGANLQRGFRNLGIDTDLGWCVDHVFDYDSDILQGPLWTLVRRFVNATQKPGLMRYVTFALSLPIKWILLFNVIVKYDRFIFFFGNTITGTAFDLWLIKVLNKQSIMVFLGSDTRPPYLNGKYFSPAPCKAKVWSRIKRLTRKRMSVVRRSETYATATINALGTSHFHTKPLVDWFYVGLPTNLADIPSTFENWKNGPLRLLHAPSSPQSKGTPEIEAAILDLQNRGYDIEYRRIENQKNDQVLASIDWCHLVVDQLFSDTPLAGLACEAAARGKPAIVGSYLAHDSEVYFRNLAFDIPTFCHPDDFTMLLQKIADRNIDLPSLGRDLYHFIQTCWTAEAVARRYLEIFEGTLPQIAMIDPSTNRCTLGHGMRAQSLPVFLQGYINAQGRTALGLQHNLALEEAVFQKQVLGRTHDGT